MKRSESVTSSRRQFLKQAVEGSVAAGAIAVIPKTAETKSEQSEIINDTELSKAMKVAISAVKKRFSLKEKNSDVLAAAAVIPLLINTDEDANAHLVDTEDNIELPAHIKYLQSTINDFISDPKFRKIVFDLVITKVSEYISNGITEGEDLNQEVKSNINILILQSRAEAESPEFKLRPPHERRKLFSRIINKIITNKKNKMILRKNRQKMFLVS